jgi:hypothetical protein
MGSIIFHRDVDTAVLREKCAPHRVSHFFRGGNFVDLVYIEAIKALNRLADVTVVKR